MKQPWWLLATPLAATALAFTALVVAALFNRDLREEQEDGDRFQQRLLLDSMPQLLLNSMAPQLRSPSDGKIDWDVQTIVAMIFGALGAAVSSAGGIGGGGLYVPMFNLLLRFSSRTSAVLSNFMIFGGMVANMIWSSFQRDPFDPRRSLIDFDAALLMQPNMLLGISLGVLFNLMFPGWLITLLLTLTLGFVTCRSCKCGLRLWRDESGLNLIESRGGEIRGEDFRDYCVAAATAADYDADADAAFKDHKLESNGDLEDPLLPNRSQEQQEQEGAEKKDLGLGFCVGLPVIKFVSLLLVWIFFFLVQLFRGSKNSEGYFHLKECGRGYWIITASQIPATLLFTGWTVWEAHKKAASNPKSKWRHATHSKAHITLPIMALLAGVLGGLLGIGGGMLVNPVLLEIGMPPQVTAATSAFMVFFSSSLSVVQYWLMGRIPVQYALFFAAICFVFSLVGLLVVQRAVRMFGRASIIVFLVTMVMGLSAIFMAGFGGLDVWKQYKAGDYMGFRPPC